MNCNLKRLLIGFLVLVLFFSCTKEETNPVSETQEYELLYYTPPRSSHKRAVLNHFLNVALGTEYGSGFKVTQKWTSEMNIFIGGRPNDELLTELVLIKDEINSLVTDGFSMNIVNDSLQSNFYLFFGPPSEYTYIFPEQFSYIQDNQDGLFHINMNNKFEIVSGHMFVNIDITDSERKKHLLREELTQSLGLANDVDYPRSIFHFEISSLTSYHRIDIEIIRLLYHPNMNSGLDRNMAESRCRSILGI